MQPFFSTKATPYRHSEARAAPRGALGSFLFEDCGPEARAGVAGPVPASTRPGVGYGRRVAGLWSSSLETRESTLK